MFDIMIIDKNNYKEFLIDGGKELDCHHKGITEIKYLPEGLEILFCGDNNLTHLPELPESLISLYCWGNNLTYLPDLPESLMALECDDNPNLPYAGFYYSEKEINKLRNRINMDLYLEGKI